MGGFAIALKLAPPPLSSLFTPPRAAAKVQGGCGVRWYVPFPPCLLPSRPPPKGIRNSKVRGREEGRGGRERESERKGNVRSEEVMDEEEGGMLTGC